MLIEDKNDTIVKLKEEIQFFHTKLLRQTGEITRLSQQCSTWKTLYD